MYFLSLEQLPQAPLTSLLIISNTGSNIEDFVHSLKHQNIVLEVDDFENRNGSDDPSYNGAIIVSGDKKDYRFSVACNTKRMNCFPVLMGIVSNALLGILNSTGHIQMERSAFPLDDVKLGIGILDRSIFLLVVANCISPYIGMSSISDYKGRRISPRSREAHPNSEEPEEDEDVHTERVQTANALTSPNMDEVKTHNWTLNEILKWLASLTCSVDGGFTGQPSISKPTRRQHPLVPGLLSSRELTVAQPYDERTLELYATVKGLGKEGAALIGKEGAALSISRYREVSLIHCSWMKGIGGCVQAAGPAEGAREDLVRADKEEGTSTAWLRAPPCPAQMGQILLLSFQLCFELSILGGPEVVLLDEPSTGMDHEGQQQMWQAIQTIVKNKEPS
ncbi:ATP-binding cassette sub-family A member 10-like [Dugong dugon]